MFSPDMLKAAQGMMANMSPEEPGLGLAELESLQSSLHWPYTVHADSSVPQTIVDFVDFHELSSGSLRRV